MTRHSRNPDQGGIPLPVLLIAVALLGAVLFFVLQDSGDSTDPVDQAGVTEPAQDEDPGFAFENFEGTAAAPRAPLAGTDEGGRVALGGVNSTTAAPVSGLVVNQSNEGVAKAKVLFTERLENAAMFRAEQEGRPIRRFTVETDGKGRYSVPRLPVGAEFEVWVHHRDYAPTSGAPVTPLPGEAQELPTILLGSGYRIFGVVLDASGAPVAADIMVSMQAMRFTGAAGPDQEEEDLEMGRVRTVTADASGRFDVVNLAQGIYSLRASAPGHATEFINPVLLQGDSLEAKQQIQLGAEKMLRGLILDETRTPVPGAKIIAGRTRPRSMHSETVHSEEDGSFELRGLTEGNYSLHVTADGFSPGRQGNVVAGRQDVEILLHHKGGVSGRVIDAAGSPVTKFSIEVYRVHQGSATYGYLGMRQSFQDANGNYVMADMDPGSYVLLVSADGFSPTYSPGFYVDREVVRGVDVRVKRGAVVIGMVSSRTDGEPVAGAQIVVHGPDFQHQDGNGLFGGWLGDPNNVPPQTVTTGKDGRFRIDNAYTGGAGEVQLTLKLEVKHAEHLVSVVPVHVAEGGEVDVGLVELTPGGSIRGSALDKDGKPIAGGTVVLTKPGGSGSFFSETRTLDARGRFQLSGLKAGTYEISVYDAKESSSLLLFTEAPSQTVYVQEGEESEVEIRLES